jgi:hypothetical protein
MQYTRKTFYTRALLASKDKRGNKMLKNLWVTFLVATILLGTFNLLQVLAVLTGKLTIHSSGRIIVSTPPLHIENGQFKDMFGNTVYLRGVLRDGYITSCTGFWQPEGESAAGGMYTWSEDAVKVHMRQLKDFGMNVMRWLLNIEWWQKDMATSLDGTPTNKHYKECVKRSIEIAQEYGIYIILCFYSVRLPGDQPSGPYPPYSNSGDEQIISNEDAFVNFWQQFANEMKNYPNVLYEVFNEPVDMPATTWFNTVQKVINAIRAIGDDHIILAQYGYCAGFEISEFLRLNDTTGNIGYANHIYRFPPGATMGFEESPPGVPAYLYDDVKRCLTDGWWGIEINYDEAVTNKIPIIITELGPWNGPEWNQTQEMLYYENILTILNEWNISYTGSHWDNPWVTFRLQNFEGTVAPFPLNKYGQILVSKIAEGKSKS